MKAQLKKDYRNPKLYRWLIVYAVYALLCMIGGIISNEPWPFGWLFLWEVCMRGYLCRIALLKQTICRVDQALSRFFISRGFIESDNCIKALPFIIRSKQEKSKNGIFIRRMNNVL